MAKHDIDNATVRSAEGWNYNAVPMLLIGFLCRIVAFVCIHARDREKRNAASLAELLKRSCRCGRADKADAVTPEKQRERRSSEPDKLLKKRANSFRVW